MDILQVIVLAIVQGLTEFLPISSSAHLVLVSSIMGWQDQGLLMDIAAHAGSLVAVTLYFKHDLAKLLNNSLRFRSEETLQDRKLVIGLVVASLPIMVCGFLVVDLVESYARSVVVIACTSILFGLLLWWAQHIGNGKRSEFDLGIANMLFIGSAQALAIIPGTSRAGVTIMAGLMIGLSLTAAARFSFLLAIPAIGMASGYKLLQIINQSVAPDWEAMLILFVLSAITAYTCIHYFLKFVNLVGMLPFVVYRVILGIVLLLFFA